MAADSERSGEQRRCAWTNQEADNLKEVVLTVPNRFGTNPEPKTFYVLPEYEARLRRFIEGVQRFGLTFVISMTVLIVAIPIAALIHRTSLIGLLISLMGLQLIVLPFATPETVKSLGFRNSIIVVRALAVIIVIIGIYLASSVRGD